MNKNDVWGQLIDLLDLDDVELVAYVYRIGPNGLPIKPFLLKRTPWPGLLDMLRDRHGGGDFKILIRQGRKMVFSGEILIEGRRS